MLAEDGTMLQPPCSSPCILAPFFLFSAQQEEEAALKKAKEALAKGKKK